MKRTIKIVIVIVGFLLSSTYTYAQDSALRVVPESKPLFNELNLLPGDIITKKLTVTNTSSTDTYSFGIATYDEIDNSGLGAQLALRIYDQSGTVYYGGTSGKKTLADLFNETDYSTIPGEGNEITLSNITPNETKEFYVEVTFVDSSGNEWQEKSTEFSFGLGYNGTILGEETKNEPKILGETGQSILIGSLVGTVLVSIALRRKHLV